MRSKRCAVQNQGITLRSATNAHHFLCMVRDGVAIKGDFGFKN